jgi:molybdopterin/thiamine biosynthesis adenylyltransferase/rhodanese-related sulfurtransferase
MTKSTRYQRQTILPEMYSSGQEKLCNSKVLVIGAGGLGIPVLQYLVASGVGHIGIIDDDKVEVTNLHRQVLYSENDLGKSKVKVAKEKLSALNSEVHIEVYEERLNTENVEKIFLNYDLIIDGSDNFGTRYLVNDACVTLNKPFISASIFKYEGQLSLFNASIAGESTATLRCLYPEPPRVDDRPNCASIGTLGAICGTIGSLASMEAIKFLVGFGSSVYNKLLVIDLLNLKINFLKLKRNPQIVSKTKIQSSNYYDNFNSCLMDAMIKEVSYKEYKEMESNGKNIMLLDVREDYEREAFNIGGAHIPLGQLLSKADTLPRDKEIVCYCQGGVRSMQAAQILKEKFGFEQVLNLTGGVNALI